jgi:acyl transferase domain-containing protein
VRPGLQRFEPGVAGSIMSDTQRGLPPGLDRAAHERRARLIAQLHQQAIATANDWSAQRKAIGAGTTKDAGRQETVAWMSIAGAFIVALGSILALLAMMQ